MENKLWENYKDMQTGQRHRRQGLRCQDQLACYTKGNVQVIALADGTGKTDLNALAGKRIVEYLARLVGENYELFYSGKKETARNLIMKGVYDIIETMMKEYGKPKEEFASTLMALAINCVEGTCCTVHLGDGIIIGKDDEKTHILSFPENGFYNDETYLTISDDGIRHIRIEKQNLLDFHELVLLSDGMYKREELYGEADSSKYICRDLEDDSSYIGLRDHSIGGIS